MNINSHDSFDEVVSIIKEVHSKLDDEGRKVLVALLDQAGGAQAAKGADGICLRFAPDRQVIISATAAKSASW